MSVVLCAEMQHYLKRSVISKCFEMLQKVAHTLYSMDVEMLRVLDTTTEEITVKKSTTSHTRSKQDFLLLT